MSDQTESVQSDVMLDAEDAPDTAPDPADEATSVELEPSLAEEPAELDPMAEFKEELKRTFDE